MRAARARDRLPTRKARAAQTWRDQGWARRLCRRAVKRARIRGLLLLPLLAGILVVYGARHRLFAAAWDRPLQIFTAIAVLVLGWALAHDLERSRRSAT